MYAIKKTHRSEFLTLRHQHYHVQLWGEPAPHKTPLVLLHGWMDVAASYQFMVDALQGDHFIIAPDWRGFGQSTTASAEAAVDSYWFADYLADLECLLDHYVGDAPINLVGHSMGGNVVMMYAGIRPQRVRRLVNLEGFGMPTTSPDQAPSRYAKWMDEIKKLHRGELDMRAYDSCEGVARRLMKTNPRLSQDKADWLAQHWAQQDANGQWFVLGDKAHKIISAHLYQVEEALALYRCIAAPVLAVEASDNSLELWWNGKLTLAQYHERLKSVPNVEIARIENAGHMVHHDQPEQLAELIERFIG